MEIKFEYIHEFKETSVDKVRGKIVAWLNAEGAQKIKENGPANIEAIHGSHRTVMGWKRNAKKKLSFTFSPSASGITVSMVASPVAVNRADVAQMADDARLNWGLLAEECWASVEGKSTTENAERMKLERSNLVATNHEAGKRMLVYGALGLVLVFAAMFAILGLTDISLPSSLFVIPGTACGLTAFWGATKMRSK